MSEKLGGYRNEILESDQSKYGLYAVPIPWIVKLGITYGCHQSCEFCGVSNLTKNPEFEIEFMSIDTAKLIAQQLEQWVPNRRIEINGYGEPLINPEVIDIVRTVRENYPSGYISMMTGGTPEFLQTDNFIKIAGDFFDNGGNVLIINSQGGTRMQYLENARKFEKISGIPYLDRIDGESEESMFVKRDLKFKKIYIVEDSGLRFLMSYKTLLCNHAGHVYHETRKKYKIKEPELPRKANCTKIFRELYVGVQGEVLLCDFDLHRQLILGKVQDKNIRDIWNSREFNFIRYRLGDYNRGKITPCMECSYLGGKGLKTLPKVRKVPIREDKNRLIDIQYQYSDLKYPGSKSKICGRICKSTYTPKGDNHES